MGSDPDFELLERWRSGDRKAGDALVAKYFGAVRRYFVNAVSDEERKDLTNETFRRLMDAMKRFKGESSVRTFLYKIARNVLADHLRRRYRQSDRGFDPLTHTVEDVEGVTPSQAVERLHRYRRLVALLRALPVEIKQMMELFYWHGCTANELAEIYEIDPTTVRTRLHAARERIKLGLAAGSSHAAGPGEHELEQDLHAVGLLLAQGPGAI
jgi:RNA polymerase sigma-70 factor, ECF subfamily